ncbi:hypothetical protein C5167_020579 [Papaver somniferum]|uniref:Uncharacterized protein n=1 Tax=Papaver somniferum TaxID=3469 RepID=A0A4Y7ITD6_PAPSO|nr:hypothetical protein C5167_020579 [Papaver somniferum]
MEEKGRINPKFFNRSSVTKHRRQIQHHLQILGLGLDTQDTSPYHQFCCSLISRGFFLMPER